MGEFVNKMYSNQQLAMELSSLVRAAVSGVITIQELYYNSLELSDCGPDELNPRLSEIFRGLEDLDLPGVSEYYEKHLHMLEHFANELDTLANMI